MIVQHNMAAENTSRQIGKNVRTNVTSMERLSSGYRINRAADDAAGLSVSEKMRGQIRGLNKGSLNCGDGMNLIQVADGALQKVHSMLDRLKELSVQAGNDTLVDEDRRAVQYEVDLLLDEIDRIGDETEFNTIKVFQGGETTNALDAVSLRPFEFNSNQGAHIFDSLPFSTEYVENDNKISTWGYFHDGGTTSSSFRIIDKNGNIGQIEEMHLDDYGGGLCTEYSILRVYSNNNIRCTQKVEIVQPKGADYKYYELSYTFENLSEDNILMDFMFCADTQFGHYNSGITNYDYGSYYMNDVEIRETTCFTDPSSVFVYRESEGGGKKLPFAQKIEWVEENQPTKFIFGTEGQLKPGIYLGSGGYGKEQITSF